jgi:hypothetical protein
MYEDLVAGFEDDAKRSSSDVQLLLQHQLMLGKQEIASLQECRPSYRY